MLRRLPRFTTSAKGAETRRDAGKQLSGPWLGARQSAPVLRRLPKTRFSLRLAVLFFAVIAAVIAQDPTSYLTPDVMRVGDKLACRCGGCRNTVGNCPMLHCDSADPMRRRIASMQSKGMADGQIINAIVREEGIVALASPPGQGLGPVVTWVMPGIVLALGIWIWSVYVRRNRKVVAPLTPVDQALMDRFRAQIDRELDEPPAASAAKPERP